MPPNRRFTVPTQAWNLASILAWDTPFGEWELLSIALRGGLVDILNDRAEQAKMKPEDYLAWRKSEWLNHSSRHAGEPESAGMAPPGGEPSVAARRPRRKPQGDLDG